MRDHCCWATPLAPATAVYCGKICPSGRQQTRDRTIRTGRLASKLGQGPSQGHECLMFVCQSLPPPSCWAAHKAAAKDSNGGCFVTERYGQKMHRCHDGFAMIWITSKLHGWPLIKLSDNLNSTTERAEVLQEVQPVAEFPGVNT